MAGRTLAGALGLTGDWDLGENNWKDANDLNLLKLSVAVQGRALELVSATPGAPTEGDVYLFDDTHPTQAGKIGVYDEAAWAYITPQEGWRMWDVDSDFMREFDGTTWIEVTSGGGGGIPDAPSDGELYGRKDGAWEIVTGGGGGGAAPFASAHFSVNGSGVITINKSTNIASITRRAAGIFSVVFTTPASDDFYHISMMASGQPFGGNFVQVASVGRNTSTGYDDWNAAGFDLATGDTGNMYDPSRFSFQCWET